MIKRIEGFRDSRFGPPLILLGLSVLCYGLYIGWMGFYWDDWPIVWFAEISEAQGLTWFEFQRPLAGPFFVAAFKLLGQSALAWQAMMVGFRWLTGVAAWWLLATIWPRRSGQALGAAMLFLVFPGFGQQFVSVTGSRHLLGLALALGSLGVMVRAEREMRSTQRHWTLRAVSIGMGLAGMLLTEYFYGMELLRPIVLWAAAREEKPQWKQVLRQWLPYALMTAGVFLWRRSITQFGNYDLEVVEELGAGSVQAVGELVRGGLGDLWTATWGAWSGSVAPEGLSELSGRARLYYWGLAAAGAAASFWALRGSDPEDGERPRGAAALGLGLAALLAGGVSFWLTGLHLKLAFPADRLFLPMMLGSALVVWGAARALLRSQGLRVLVISGLIGLAVGAHFLNALDYRTDWAAQQNFLQQLAWRAPGLKAGTTLVSEELSLNYATDNALTAALNAMYGPDFKAPAAYYDYEYRIDEFIGLPVAMRYLDLRLGWQLPYPSQRYDYEAPYRYFKIRGNSADVLALYYQPPYCLRALDPIYDAGHPHFLSAELYAEHPEWLDPVFAPDFPSFPLETIDALPFSRTDLILTETKQPAELPGAFGDEQSGAGSWCQYFEWAELARQRGDWDEVARLGDEALDQFKSPQHASELVVFIEGYGRVGDWEAARALSRRALEMDGSMQLMLCQAWGRLEGVEANDMLRDLGCKSD